MTSNLNPCFVLILKDETLVFESKNDLAKLKGRQHEIQGALWIRKDGVFKVSSDVAYWNALLDKTPITDAALTGMVEGQL